MLEFQTTRGKAYWLIPNGRDLPRREKVTGEERSTARSLRLREGYRIWLGKPGRSEYYLDEESSWRA